MRADRWVKVTGLNPQPTGYWAVDRLYGDHGIMLHEPLRVGVFTEAAAREFAAARRAYPRDYYRVAELWQGTRDDGSLLPSYVPADLRVWVESYELPGGEEDNGDAPTGPDPRNYQPPAFPP